MQQKHNYFFIWVATIAAFAGILFGYDTGVISGAILFIKTQFHLTPLTNGLVVSAVLFGALWGAIVSGRMADHFGRKRLLIAVSLIFIFGSIGTALAQNMLTLVIGRIIIGIAIGISSYTAPLYISEIAPAKHRGALVSLNQLTITIGILLSYLIDYYFAQAGNWRMMLAMGVVPASCLFLGMLFLPDSPRWMIAKAKFNKALHILRRIRHSEVHVQMEFQAIQESVKQSQDNWRALFSKALRPTLVIGVGLAVLQQVTGINTIIYYAPTIFQMAGFHSAVSAILATIGVGIVFVLFTVIALPLIDIVGRRPLLFIGLIGMALCLGGMALVFSPWLHGAFVSKLALTCMLLYIASFAISLGPIMWLMIAEIYPLRIRGFGASLATCANWGSNMIVALTFLTLINHLGPSWTFIVYLVISIAGIYFVDRFIPETKGISLEQIEKNLYQGLPARELGQ